MLRMRMCCDWPCMYFTDKRGEFSSLLLAGGVAAAAIAGGLLLDDGVQLGEKVR